MLDYLRLLAYRQTRRLKDDDVAEAAPRYAKSSAEFDSWFKKRVEHLTGINPDQQPLGPPTSQIFSWSDDQRPHSDLGARAGKAAG